MNIGNVSNQLFFQLNPVKNKINNSFNFNKNDLNNDIFVKSSNSVSFKGNFNYDAKLLTNLFNENKLLAIKDIALSQPTKFIDAAFEILKDSKGKESLQNKVIFSLSELQPENFYHHQEKFEELVNKNILTGNARNSAKSMLKVLEESSKQEYQLFIRDHILNKEARNAFIDKEPAKAFNYIVKFIKEPFADIGMKEEFCDLFKLLPKYMRLNKKNIVEKAINSTLEFSDQIKVNRLKDATVNSDLFKFDLKKDYPKVYEYLNSIDVYADIPTDQMVKQFITKSKDLNAADYMVNKVKTDKENVVLNELCDIVKDTNEHGDIRTSAFDIIYDAGKLDYLMNYKKTT